ncbi:MAG: glucosyltransferase domain-containing protein [Oscillospiraceae bacterium]|nr:glucosyltransferase domain-containing protein [Oscillospiraceae bacterium]
MLENNCNELYFEKLFHRFTAFVYKNRYVFSGSFLIGLLSYVYFFTNKLPNHDDLFWFFQKGASIESGRFVLVLLSFILPDFSMPWIYGILSLLFFTLGNCLIIRIFHIRTSVIQFLLSGIIICFPSLIGTFTYTFTTLPYAICYFLTVLAALLLTNGSRRCIPFSVVAIVGAVGIYQAYLSITVSILILFLMQQLLLENGSVEKLFVRGLSYIAVLLAALAVYWGISSLLWTFGDSSMGGYASNALTFSLSSIFGSIKNAYIGCIRVLRYRHYGLIASPFSLLIHYIAAVLAGFELLAYMFRCRSIPKILFLLFLIGIFPLGINCIYIFVSVDSIHTLVLFSYIALYIFFAMLIEYGLSHCFFHNVLNRIHRLGLDISATALAIIIICNVYLANEAYLGMQLAYENTYAFSTNVVTQLQMNPDYHPDSKVTLVGEFPQPEFYQYFAEAQKIAGTAGLYPDTYSIQWFYTYYVGYPLNLVSSEYCITPENQQLYEQMPAYPNHGYIAKIDDVFVIKLSDLPK